MRLYSGIDLIEIERVQQAIQRHGERFLGRVFTVQELAECNGHADSLAARFAAKEAAAKALGTGIGQVGWQDVEIMRGVQNEPLLSLHGAAARLAAEMGWQTWALSLSHTHSHAVALVVAIAEHPPGA